MTICIEPPGGTATVQSVTWTAEARKHADAVGVVADVVSMPRYRGAYGVVPSPAEQIIETEGLMMDRNFTVGAIPNNYGLITWDGSTITIS